MQTLGCSSTKTDDAFWCTLGAMMKDSFEKNIILAALTMENDV